MTKDPTKQRGAVASRGLLELRKEDIPVALSVGDYRLTFDNGQWYSGAFLP